MTAYLLTGVCLLLAIGYVGWMAGILWTVYRMEAKDLTERDAWHNNRGAK